MSEAIKLANNAALEIEGLLAEMLEGDWPDNKILLGTLGTDNSDEEIQVQLLITRDPKTFMDEQ